MNFYNAAAGISDTSATCEFSAYVKDKIVSDDNDEVWDKPAKIYLNHIGNMNNKAFYNISYIYDGYSFYSRNTIYAGYARKLKMFGSSSLSVGGRLILNIDNVDWDKLGQIEEKPSKSTGITPDFDLGAQFNWGGLTVGTSAKNLLASSFKVDGEELIKDWREVYLNASYSLGFFKQNFKVAPYMLVVFERDVEMDAGLNLTFYNTVDVSYALSVFELRSVLTTKVKLFKKFQVGFAIDKSTVFSDNNLDFLVSYKF